MSRDIRIAQLQKLAEDDPEDPFLPYALALEFLDTDPLQAESLLVPLVEVRFYLPAFYQLASLYFNTGRIQQAAQITYKGIELATSLGDNHTLNELKALANMIALAE